MQLGTVSPGVLYTLYHFPKKRLCYCWKTGDGRVPQAVRARFLSRSHPAGSDRSHWRCGARPGPLRVRVRAAVAVPVPLPPSRRVPLFMNERGGRAINSPRAAHVTGRAAPARVSAAGRAGGSRAEPSRRHAASLPGRAAACRRPPGVRSSGEGARRRPPPLARPCTPAPGRPALPGRSRVAGTRSCRSPPRRAGCCRALRAPAGALLPPREWERRWQPLPGTESLLELSPPASSSSHEARGKNR